MLTPVLRDRGPQGRATLHQPRGGGRFPTPIRAKRRSLRRLFQPVVVSSQPHLSPRLEKPRIGLQVIDCFDHRLADAEVGLPAKLRDARGIEINERAVADPPALAAGIVAPRLKADALADPGERLIDGAIFRCAKVKNMHTRVDALSRVEHRADAILDVQIALALLAIAQYFDAGWVGLELSQEVEHMAMRIALAEDGNEAEDAGFEAKPRAIGADQTFAGQFAGRIERSLNRKRAILRRRKDAGLAIHRTGGGEGNVLDAGLPHRLEHVMGGNGILLQIARGMIGTEAYVGICCKVKNPVMPPDGTLQ